MRRKTRRSSRNTSPVRCREFQPLLSRLEERTLLSTITWTGDAGNNNWDTPGNWSSDSVPTASDDAVVGSTGTTIAVTGIDFANSLSSQDAISISGSLSLISASAIYNTLTITGSVMGSATVYAEAGIDFAGNASLDGITLNSYGAGALSGGNIEFADGAVFNNLVGATFDAQADGTIGNLGQAGTFNNAGSFTKSTGTGTIVVRVQFNNSGTVSVTSGTLSLQRGGTSTGAFTGASGTTLDFQGSHNLSGPVTGDTVTYGSNGVDAAQAVNLSGPYSASRGTYLGWGNPDLRGTTVHFTGPVASVGAMGIGNSTADFSPPTPVTLTVPTVDVDFGTLTGTDSFVVTGPSVFAADTLSGSGTIDADGNVRFDAVTTLDGRTFNNHAVATTTAPDSFGLAFADNAVFNNLAGATFDDTVAGTIGDLGQAGTFNNAGSFTTSAGTGTTVIGVPFNNSGIVSVTSGTLSLQRGGTSTGSFTGASGTTLDFQGSHNLSGPVTGDTVSFGSNSIDAGQAVTLSGPYSACSGTYFGWGNPDVRGTTVHFTGPVAGVGAMGIGGNSTADFSPNTPVTLTVPALSVDFGTLTGTDSFVVTGPSHLTVATLSGSGTFDTDGNVRFDAVTTLDGRTFNNHAAATTNPNDPGIINFANNGVFNNLAGATFDDTVAGTIGDLGQAGTFNNVRELYHVGRHRHDCHRRAVQQYGDCLGHQRHTLARAGRDQHGILHRGQRHDPRLSGFAQPLGACHRRHGDLRKQQHRRGPGGHPQRALLGIQRHLRRVGKPRRSWHDGPLYRPGRKRRRDGNRRLRRHGGLQPRHAGDPDRADTVRRLWHADWD
jgi:hypothetical protein